MIPPSFAGWKVSKTVFSILSTYLSHSFLALLRRIYVPLVTK